MILRYPCLAAPFPHDLFLYILSSFLSKLNSLVKLCDHSHAYTLKSIVSLLHTYLSIKIVLIGTSINAHHQPHLPPYQHLYPHTLSSPLPPTYKWITFLLIPSSIFSIHFPTFIDYFHQLFYKQDDVISHSETAVSHLYTFFPTKKIIFQYHQ